MHLLLSHPTYPGSTNGRDLQRFFDKFLMPGYATNPAESFQNDRNPWTNASILFWPRNPHPLSDLE